MQARLFRDWRLSLLTAAALLGLVVPAGRYVEDPDLAVIIRETDPRSSTVEKLVERLGGVVVDQLELIGGFTARVPAGALVRLAGDPGVSAITPDAKLTMDVWSGAGWESAVGLLDYNPITTAGSMYNVAQIVTGAGGFWEDGFDGSGVDVALIDTGVVPVNGLTTPGKVVNGADLSFESQSERFRYLDTYGHGTHMAGIIAGRDDQVPQTISTGYWQRFVGMAPGARIVNVKVGDFQGSTDVSQVIAAIDWVVQHRYDNGMNIRVINLSYGTDGGQTYALDPLAFAVEQAWKKGIVVVVAAGNDGNSFALRNPAFDPFVIAVGATASGTTLSTNDDTVQSFSNCGNDARSVDIVAPGKSIVSLRNPGSFADLNYPSAVVAERFFLGSGTSQAAAVVSGAVALIIDQRPNITPDQVKKLLKSTAEPIPSASALCQGAGLLDLWTARVWSSPSAKASRQSADASTGTGTLEGARGSAHLEHNGVVLEGEVDILGMPWVGPTWASASAAGTSWSGGTWNGGSWSGASWSGTSWSGTSWSGTNWSGTSWSGASWSGTSWSGMSWSGGSWSGGSWSGTSWSGTSWSGTSWSGLGWGAMRGQSWD
jgi:serine protease AprX